MGSHLPRAEAFAGSWEPQEETHRERILLHPSPGTFSGSSIGRSGRKKRRKSRRRCSRRGKFVDRYASESARARKWRQPQL
jgi:hypothetical protein